MSLNNLQFEEEIRMNVCTRMILIFLESQKVCLHLDGGKTFLFYDKIIHLERFIK